MTSSILCPLEGVWGWRGDILKTQLPPESEVDYSQVCRLLGGQMARAGVATPHRPCRLLLPMPTLLTACTRGTGSVMCRLRWGATPAEKRGNRRLGRLPMSNGSRQGKAHPCESANACICKICPTAPAYERPPLTETFCSIVSQQNFTRHKVKKFKHLYK
jgi:hypothetical protein